MTNFYLKHTTVEKWLPRLALGLIMAWPLLLVDKGFDLIDTGYYLAFFRDSLRLPDHNTLSQVLTNWLGALIYAALPDSGQMLALRLICVGFYALITWFSFLVLREHFPLWLNLLALALASVQATALIYTVSYNTFSYLFLSAAILLLYRGLARNRPLFLYLAAIILGLNPFVRLPNLLQWGLAAVPFWYYWFCLGQRGRAVSLTFRFCLVLLVTWLAFLGLLGLTLGPQWLNREIGALADIIHGNVGRHSAFKFWDTYDLIVRDSLKLLAWLATRLLPLSLALVAALGLFGRRRGAALALAALGLAVGLVSGLADLSWLPDGGFPGQALGGWLFVPGLRYQPVEYFLLRLFCNFLSWGGPAVGLLGLLWYHQRRPLLSVFSGLIMVIFLAMPFGTDYYIRHYLYYTHLSVAGVLGLVWRLGRDGAAWLEEKWPRFKFQEAGGAALLGVNAVFWFILALAINAFNSETYFAHHGDLEYQVAASPVAGVPVLAGMKTNPGRALGLADLRRRTEPYRGKPLVVLGQCPLCVLVSETESLFPYPWADLLGQPREEFKNGLDQAARTGPLPLVLLVDPGFEPWMSRWKNTAKEVILKQFLQEQKYTLGAATPAYSLYLPPGLGPEGPPVVFFKPRPAGSEAPKRFRRR